MAKTPKKDVKEEPELNDEPGAQERFEEATKRLLSTPPKPKPQKREK